MKRSGKKNRFIDVFVIIICAAIIISFLPVCVLYVRRAPAPYTNAQSIEKIEKNKGGCFKFIVFSDNHAGLIFNDSATLKLIRHMNREDRFRKVPIDLVLNAGDLAFRGSKWDYFIYNKIRSLVKWPVISAVGNHDDDKGGSDRFKKYIGDDEVSFANRNSYFITVNNSSGELSDSQFARLEEELKKSMAYQHRFVIAHKPPFSPYQQSWYRAEFGGWAYRFMKLCEKYKVDMVFLGHEHMFKKVDLGGVKYIVSAGGGMLTHIPSEDGGYLHYTVVEVFGDYVTFEVRKIFPPLWEFLTYYLWKEVFYFLLGVLF